MAKPKENSERTYVFLNKDDLAVLKNQAEREGSNVSLILRRLTKEYISMLKKSGTAVISSDGLNDGIDAIFDALPGAAIKGVNKN